MTDVAALVSALVARHGGAASVARLLGGRVTARSVLRHADGATKPTPWLVSKYEELAAMVAPAPSLAPVSPVEASTVPEVETSAQVPPSPAPGAPFDPNRSTLESVIALAAKAHAALERAESDALASHRDRSAAIGALTRVLEKLALLRGELAPSEATIIRSPAWTRAMGVIVDALRPYPEAARAVAEAVAALESPDGAS